MSSQITTAFVQQYSANIQMLSQQMGSLLRDKVRVESVVGKNAFFDQVGSVTAQLRASRHADTPQVDTPHSRRRVSLADYEFADLIDQQDKVRLLIDPTSSYAQAAAMAMGRAMDDVLITAALGTASTGETGTGTETVQTGVAKGSTGLTVAKLISAKDLLDKAGSDVRFMHCLPAHRGEEVDDHIVDCKRSIVFDQAENRLHAQKAVLAILMSKEY